VVTKRSDPTPNGCHRHDCSLREAILAANNHPGVDAVVLPKAKTYDLTIANTDPAGEDAGLQGDLDVTHRLHVVHPGRGLARVDANQIDRVFHLLANGDTGFKRIAITGGLVPTTAPDGGGGIRSEGADLALSRSRVVGNRTLKDFGGGIDLADKSAPNLTMTRTTVRGNRSNSDSGGIDGADGGTWRISRSKIIGNTAATDAGGLDYFSSDPSRITKSTIAGNSAGSSTNGGGGILTFGPLSVSGSTIADNHTGVGGGGIAVANGGKLHIVNSTVAGNGAGTQGGGIFEATGAAGVRANAITVARNDAGGFGGGLYYNPQSIGFDVGNSLVALNTATVGSPDCGGDAFDSLGHNLFSTLAGCSGFTGPGDIVRANPRIGQLGNNGGPTKTIPLKKGSPAIGHAKRSSAPKRDQRGRKRDRHPDTGAFERTP